MLTWLEKTGQIKRTERYNKFDRRKGKSSQGSKNYGGEVRKKRARDSYWKKRCGKGFQMGQDMFIFKLHILVHLPSEIYKVMATISTDACKYSRSEK